MKSWLQRFLTFMLSSVLQDVTKLQKRISFASQVTLAKSLMLAKWLDEYKEAQVASAFASAWSGLLWTLAEMSADWYGGISPTNNPLENLNKHFKVALNLP